MSFKISKKHLDVEALVKLDLKRKQCKWTPQVLLSKNEGTGRYSKRNRQNEVLQSFSPGYILDKGRVLYCFYSKLPL